jgi:hypothetical protein
MLKFLLAGGKLLTSLVILHASLYLSLPMILYIGFAWCVWLWFDVREWKGRLLAALGFALTAFGWWVSRRESYFIALGETSHTSEIGRHWARMAHMNFWEGMELMTVGVLLLTYADHRRRPRLKQTSEVSSGAEADQTNVWPPAPKKPQ